MIGRSPFADVVVADESVAPHHAELVVTDDGRLHLTDCATEAGTWRLVASSGGDRRWHPVRQSFVREGAQLRLGGYRCTAGDLLRAARGDADARRSELQWERLDGFRRRLRGRVERDAITGEIVRRRP